MGAVDVDTRHRLDRGLSACKNRSWLRPLVPRIGWILVGAVVLASCGSSVTSSHSQPAYGANRTTTARGPSASVPVTRGAGAPYTMGNKIPSNFPAAVPLPQGYSVLSSTTAQRGSGGWMLTLAVKGSVSSVVHAYRHQLAAAGFSLTNPVASGPSQAINAVSRHWLVSASAEAGTRAGTGPQSRLPAGEVVLYLAVSSAKSLKG